MSLRSISDSDANKSCMGSTDVHHTVKDELGKRVSYVCRGYKDKQAQGCVVKLR